MGCDIHMALEKLVKQKWIMVTRFPINHPATHRNYRRFADLAGVRRNYSTAKGLPEDISESTKLFFDESEEDLHHYSFEDIVDAAKIFVRTHTQNHTYAMVFPYSYFFDIEKEDIKHHQ